MQVVANADRLATTVGRRHSVGADWIARLALDRALLPAEVEILREWVSAPIAFMAGQHLLLEGARDEHMLVVLDGWIARYRQLRNGRRQIISLVMTGEEEGFWPQAGGQLRQSFVSLGPSMVALVPRDALTHGLEISPKLQIALSERAQRARHLIDERVVDLGVRSALERGARFFCELGVRSGMPEPLRRLPLPLTQADFADLLGFSVVHANRVLQGLRQRELLTWRKGTVEILNFDELARLGGFEASQVPVA